MYPVRLRLVNIDDDAPVWITIAYIPVIPTLQETAGEARARQRRTNIFQRVLYAALRSTIGASHGGVAIYDPVGQRTLTAYPRILAYLCDQPEERAVVCLKQGQCAHPCTSCMVNLADSGSPEAVTAEERDALDGLQKQWEATTHRLRNRESARLLDLHAKYSLNASMPALACFAGLSTAPFLMYKMIGFDALHVRLSVSVPVAWLSLSRGDLSVNADVPATRSDSNPLLLAMNVSLTGIVLGLGQILDQGVTRMLVHRLMAVFPHMKDECKPPLKSRKATASAANDRGKELHRRSRVSKAPPG